MSKPDMWHVPRNGNYIIVVKPGDTSMKGERLTGQPTLEQLRDGVGGDIELVPLFNKLGTRGCIAFCNEHGRRLGFQPNQLAQMLWSQAYGRRIYEDILVGPIVIIVGSPSFLAEL